MIAYREKISGATHLALVRGEIDAGTPRRWCACTSRCRCSICSTPAPGTHSWGVHEALARDRRGGQRRHGAAQLLRKRRPAARARRRRRPSPGRRASSNLLTYGIGAQILRDLNVGQDAADGRAAQDAEHGRLGSGGRRLRRSLERQNANAAPGNERDRHQSGRGGPAHRHRARPLQRGHRRWRCSQSCLRAARRAWASRPVAG